MLNWLFSSFTYLPNFIIWLPSFSSSWFVQLASKCHLAIFAFVRFLDFFHSLKKVSKPCLFCEFMCIKEDLLVRIFFKTKKFVNLFFLSFAWFTSGEEISFGVIFTGEKFWGVLFTRGSLHRGYFHRTQFSRGQFSGGQFSWYPNYFRDLYL